MGISIFLSYPKPYLCRQQDFVDRVVDRLNGWGLTPRTLGATDYDMGAPLKGIRRLMIECNGLLTIAFRRASSTKIVIRPNTDIPGHAPKTIANAWLSSPYCQIEPAMAFQAGLPILIFREKGVVADGVLEIGVTGLHLPEFDLDSAKDWLEEEECKQLLRQWAAQVQTVHAGRGEPPKLY